MYLYYKRELLPAKICDWSMHMPGCEAAEAVRMCSATNNVLMVQCDE